MAVDASAGLVHLHQMGVIHRDIATRNMLIDSQMRCRVCDFGLSRIKQKQYSAVTTKSIVGPVKWMAPESISHQRYSEASDVYMFGITLWEMFAREEPYPDMEPLAAALAVVTQGLRPQIPLPNQRYCPIPILQLMKSCWLPQPEQRPNMKTVNDVLVKVLDSL
jgi:serine/threonine protein kinase